MATLEGGRRGEWGRVAEGVLGGCVFSSAWPIFALNFPEKQRFVIFSVYPFSMSEIEPPPVLPAYLTDLGYVLGVLESLARDGGERPTQGQALKSWHDLLFAVWCWIKDGNHKALSTYLRRGGDLAWESLCDVVNRPLVMRQKRSFDALIYAFPITVQAHKGDIVGRFRFDSNQLPRIRLALSEIFPCKRVWFLPELLSAHAVRDLSYSDHLNLTESIVAGRLLPAFVHRPPTRVSPGRWSGLLTVWHDSADARITAESCSSAALAKLQAATMKALPNGFRGQVVAEPVVSYLNAAVGIRSTRRPAVRRSLTGPVKNEQPLLFLYR